MVASFGRCGMMGKTWRILLSSGIALNNQITLQLLKANNSTGHLSIIRNVSTDPLSLDLVFIIASVLRSFPTYTAPGPSIKISSFFQPLQFEVACRSGAEKIIHRLSRNSIEEHWMEADFVTFKVVGGHGCDLFDFTHTQMGTTTEFNNHIITKVVVAMQLWCNTAFPSP